MRVPRSALTFSAEGKLGVRTVDADGVVALRAGARSSRTRRDEIWVAGTAGGARVIVQGQDFVKDGQKVETPVEAGAARALRSRGRDADGATPSTTRSAMRG